MKFWTSSNREWALVGVLVGVVLTIGAYSLATWIAIVSQ